MSPQSRRAKQIKVFQKTACVKNATGKSRAISPMFQQNHHNSRCEVITPHTSGLETIFPVLSRQLAPSFQHLLIGRLHQTPLQGLFQTSEVLFFCMSSTGEFSQFSTNLHKYINFQCPPECCTASNTERKIHLWCFIPKHSHMDDHQSLVISILVASLNVDIRRAIHKLCQVEHMLLGNVGQAQIPMLIDLQFVFSFWGTTS